MIGNAVPSMFSYKLAQSVIGYLKLHEANTDKHSALTDLAKRAVDPAIKAASLVSNEPVITPQIVPRSVLMRTSESDSSWKKDVSFASGVVHAALTLIAGEAESFPLRSGKRF